MKIKDIPNKNLFRHNNRLYWKTGEFDGLVIAIDMATGDVEKIPGSEHLDSLIGRIEMGVKNEDRIQRQAT